MKILVVRFSSIGDIVLTFPVVRCLKEQLSNAEIHFLTKSAYSSLLSACPAIDKTHLLEKELSEILPRLKQEKFDVVIDLHNNLRTHLLTRKLGVKTYRFPKLNIEKWLLTTFKINRLPDVHVVDRYFEAVKQLGVKNDGKNNQFYIAEKDFIAAENYQLEPKNFLAIAVGAQFATKRVPLNKWLEILSKVDVPVALLGGKEDREFAVQLCESLPQKKLVNLCGELSLAGSASIVSQAKKVIANDTGLMHIAACFEVPIITIWGNTVPDLGMYAYKPQKDVTVSQFEVKDLSCRPCSKIGFQKCPKGHFKCMQLQDAKAISEAVLE